MMLLTVSAFTLLGILATAFALGAAPVFTVRLIAMLYPRNDPIRTELVAEMVHVKGGVKNVAECWHWLGETFATAACEAMPARKAARRSRKAKAPIGKIHFVARTTDGTIVPLEGILSTEADPMVTCIEIVGAPIPRDSFRQWVTRNSDWRQIAKNITR